MGAFFVRFYSNPSRIVRVRGVNRVELLASNLSSARSMLDQNSVRVGSTQEFNEHELSMILLDSISSRATQ